MMNNEAKYNIGGRGHTEISTFILCHQHYRKFHTPITVLEHVSRIRKHVYKDGQENNRMREGGDNKR